MTQQYLIPYRNRSKIRMSRVIFSALDGRAGLTFFGFDDRFRFLFSHNSPSHYRPENLFSLNDTDVLTTERFSCRGKLQKEKTARLKILFPLVTRAPCVLSVRNVMVSSHCKRIADCAKTKRNIRFREDNKAVTPSMSIGAAAEMG